MGSEGEIFCPRVRESMKRAAGPFQTQLIPCRKVGRDRGEFTGSCSQKRETRL